MGNSTATVRELYQGSLAYYISKAPPVLGCDMNLKQEIEGMWGPSRREGGEGGEGHRQYLQSSP
uniref:Uncharacterized protein n=1 Tax=Anguilla anguilla TaxID=7936 RepID=A0A0E9S2W4_ANGAN